MTLGFLRPLMRRVDRLLGQASALVAARLGAAALTVSVPFVLARQLTREDFGVYKQFFLVLMTVLLIGQLGLTQSLYYFLPRREPGRGAYVTQALLGLAFMGLLAGIGIAFLPWFGPYRLLLAVACAAILTSAPLDATLVSEGRIGAAAAAYFAWEVLRGAALVAGAWWGGLAGCLIAATVAILVRAGAVGLLFGTGVLPRGRPGRATVRKQLAYALPFAGSALLYVAQRQLSPSLVSLSFDPATFALFSVAMFHLQGVDMVYTPMTEVLMVRLGHAAAADDRAAMNAIWRETVTRLGSIFLPATALCFAVGRFLLPALFTTKYSASIPLFMVMTVEMIAALLPFDSVLRVAAETRFLLRVNALRVVCALVTIGLGIHFAGLLGAAIGTVISEVGGRLFMLVRVRRVLGMPVRALLPVRALASIAARSALAAAPAVAATQLPGSLAGRAFYGIAAYGLAYGAIELGLRALRGTAPARLEAQANLR